MKDKTSKYFDIQAEELLLAAAINIRKLATSPKFRPALFSGERVDLCNAIIAIERKGESFTSKHLEIYGCGEAALLAFGLIKDLDGYPDTGEFDMIAQKLADLSMRRHVSEGARDLHSEVSSLSAGDAIRKVNEFANKTQALMDGGNIGELQNGADINDLIDRLRYRMENPDTIQGITTGMGMAFDRAIDGLCGGRLILIGGRPHLGKTSLGIEFAGGAMESGKSVAYFSAEMTKLQLQEAMLDLYSGISVKPGFKPNKGELQKIKLAATKLAGFKWHIDDGNRMDIDSICAKARMLHRAKGLDMAVVDYAQIIQGSDVRDDMRLMIAEISGKLKGLAKELDIPVVLLSQINRAAPRMDPKTGGNVYPKPALRDLKESSSLESDADIVILIDRNLECEDPREPEVDADLIIAKNRGTGLLCTVPVKFVRAHRCFKVKNFWQPGC